MQPVKIQNKVTNFMYATSLYKRRWMNFKQFRCCLHVGMVPKKTLLNFHLSHIFHSFLLHNIARLYKQCCRLRWCLHYIPRTTQKPAHAMFGLVFFIWLLVCLLFCVIISCKYNKKENSESRWITNEACICHQISKLCK